MTATSANLSIEGPILEVHFYIPLELEKRYIAEGKKVPDPVVVKAMIDTGASHCVIQKQIPENIGLEPVGTIKINTPSTKDHQCYQYFMRMILPHQNLTYEGVFTAAPLEGQNINCLIGRDVLANGILIYIGYMNQFTFSLL